MQILKCRRENLTWIFQFHGKVTWTLDYYINIWRSSILNCFFLCPGLKRKSHHSNICPGSCSYRFTFNVNWQCVLTVKMISTTAWRMTLLCQLMQSRIYQRNVQLWDDWIKTIMNFWKASLYNAFWKAKGKWWLPRDFQFSLIYLNHTSIPP